jgi:hypothetical protein
MEVMLLYLLGFAAVGASVRQRALSLWLIAFLVVALVCTLWLTGRV